MAQAPGQKGAFVPDSSEPRRIDTKPLTTDSPLPVWGTRQVIGLSQRGDLRLAPPGWFGQGLLTRPSSPTAVSGRWPVTYRPTVGRTAASGPPPNQRTVASEAERREITPHDPRSRAFELWVFVSYEKS